MSSNYENRLRLLEEQVIKLRRENDAICTILNKRVYPVVQAVEMYQSFKRDDVESVIYG